MVSGLLRAIVGQSHRHEKRVLPAAFRSVRLVAHRGIHAECPENSLCAIRAASAKGYPVELDVRCTMDGHPVVFHDRTLQRMTGVNGVVEELRLDELRACRLRYDDKSTHERIPTLAEALKIVREGVIVEAKGTWHKARW